jgi:polysaccharide export outer membrane protein
MKRFGILFSIVTMSLLAGCFSRTASVAVAGGDDSSLIGFYQLRSMDPLDVNLLGIPEEKNIQTVIDEKGNITLPYINEPVKASGLTTSELEREIRKIYIDGQIYRNITVNVLTSAKTYYMEGEIRNPGGYVLGSRITLLQAIAAASGYTEYADKTDIIITRNGQIIKANAKYLEKHPGKDIPIEAGDRIKIDRSMF